MGKRKSMVIVMAAVLAVMSGCTAGSNAGNEPSNLQGAGADGSGEKVLTVSWWGNQIRNDRTQEVLDMYSREHPGIVFDSQPSQISDYWTKLATAGAGNSLPDVLQMNYGSYLEQYAKSGLLEDLTPYVEKGTLDVSEIDPDILDSGKVDGKLYAICSGVNVPALIYNKTLTDELGIEIENNMTLEEFMDVSREIYEKSGVKTDLGYGNSEGFMTYFMRGEGVDNLFSGEKFAISGEDGFLQFFEIYETGYQEGWMLDAGIYAELTVNSVEQCPLVYYSSPATQSWCACYWSNQLTAMQEAAPEGVELEYATWPAKDPKLANYLHPSMFFSVASGSANKDEAVSVVDYLINDFSCNEILLAERGVPAPKDVEQAITDKLPVESQKEIEFINEVVIPNSSPISPCPPDKATEVFSLADDLVEKVLYGQLTAKEASSQLFNEGNGILQK